MQIPIETDEFQQLRRKRICWSNWLGRQACRFECSSRSCSVTSIECWWEDNTSQTVKIMTVSPNEKSVENASRTGISKQFAERLAAALVARGIPVSAIALQRAFNARNPELAITAHAARKWLMGESIPTQAHLRVVAEVLGCQRLG